MMLYILLVRTWILGTDGSDFHCKIVRVLFFKTEDNLNLQQNPGFT